MNAMTSVKDFCLLIISALLAQTASFKEKVPYSKQSLERYFIKNEANAK